MGLGAVSLRSLGLLQQLLGVVSAQLLSPTQKLVAAGAGSVRVCGFQLRFTLLLVSALLSPAGSAFALLSTKPGPFDAVAFGRACESASSQPRVPARCDCCRRPRFWQPCWSPATSERRRCASGNRRAAFARRRAGSTCSNRRQQFRR